MRRALLLLSAVAALTGVLAGLARMGVALSVGTRYVGVHGPLLAVGFFGTVIGLERAVALAHRWAFSAPVLGAASIAALLAHARWAPLVAIAASVALALVNLAIVRRQMNAHTALMALGSMLLVLANVMWQLGRPVPVLVPSWIGFFVLTIAAERLELSRLAPTPRWAKGALIGLALVSALLASLHTLELADSQRGFGAVMAAIAVWQLRFDLARRRLSARGLPRFAALGVLLGAAWLAFSGVIFASVELPFAGPLYDAALHGVFVGYVLSMVFAHAPIILPAVARIEISFARSFFIPLALLHVGLVVRVAGDFLGLVLVRRVGGVANVVSMALFALVVILSRGRK